MKKGLMVIGGIVVTAVIIIVVVFLAVSATSKKLKCKSPEGNIIIMYNDKTITGYTASKMTYDLDGQKKIAEQIGVDSYLEQFKIWFSTNTSGTCK